MKGASVQMIASHAASARLMEIETQAQRVKTATMASTLRLLPLIAKTAAQVSTMTMLMPLLHVNYVVLADILHPVEQSVAVLRAKVGNSLVMAHRSQVRVHVRAQIALLDSTATTLLWHV